MPDDRVFEDITFDLETVSKRLREIAFLNKGIKIVLIDERKLENGKPFTQEFKYEGGLSDFVKYLNENKTVEHPKPIYFEAKSDLCQIVCAMQYTNNYTENTFSYVSKIIYKPRASTQGNGIKVFILDKDNKKLVYENLKRLPKGIIEGYIKQHPEMCKYSECSVNTIRVVTIRCLDNVNILYAAMRMGGGNSVVDNFHAGGILSIVDVDTGCLITDGFDMYGNPFVVHPVTNEKVMGFKIPYWKEVIKLVQKASVIVDGIGYVGWDIAITDNGPILIEGNTSPGSLVLQTPYAIQHRGMKYVVEKYL